MRGWEGGVGVFWPRALHAGAVSRLFAALAGERAAHTIVAALQWAAWPWIAAIGVAVIAGAKRVPARSIELVSITALLTFASPLIGFTIFFCGMHGARHVSSTRDYSDSGTLRQLLRAAACPTLATVAGVPVGWVLLAAAPLHTPLWYLLLRRLPAPPSHACDFAVAAAAAFPRDTTSAGSHAGANHPGQSWNRTSGCPGSVIVGTSGRKRERFAPVTARIRMVPAR